MATKNQTILIRDFLGTQRGLDIQEMNAVYDC